MMLRSVAGYALAGLVGCSAPAIVLWMARTAAPGSNPVWPALAVIAGLGVFASLIVMLMPARRLTIGIILAAPLCLVAIAMFAALVDAGAGYFWIWLAVAAGGVAAAFLGVLLGARRRVSP